MAASKNRKTKWLIPAFLLLFLLSSGCTQMFIPKPETSKQISFNLGADEVPITDHSALTNLEWNASGHYGNLDNTPYNITADTFFGNFVGNFTGNLSGNHAALSNLEYSVSGHWVADNNWIYLNSANTTGIRFANSTVSPPTGQIEVNWKFYAPNIYSGNAITGNLLYTNYIVMGNPAYSPSIADNYFYMINPADNRVSFTIAKTGALTFWEAQKSASYITWKDNSSPTPYTKAGIGVYNNSGTYELEIWTQDSINDPIQMYSTTNFWEDTALYDGKYLFFDYARSKSLWYDATDARFEFNDSLFVDGDINTSSRMIINDTNIQDGMLWISSGDDVNMSNRQRMIFVQTNTSSLGYEATRFVVLGDGTTGINTNTPNDMLDVNGDIILSGVAAYGSRYVYADSAGSMGNNLTIQAGYGGCFPAETLISTPYGYKRMDSLEIGQLISAYDTERSISTTARVEQITRLNASGYYHINGDIKATAEHPFWTKSGWVAAENLTTADELFDGTGWIPVSSIVYVGSAIEVFKLEVSKPYTFFVNGVLVHNKSPTPRRGGDLYLAGGYGSYGARDGDVYLCADVYGTIGYCYVESDLTVNGDVYANYFIGDGSLLTNLTGYWNRTGTLLEPATAGDNVSTSGNMSADNFFAGSDFWAGDTFGLRWDTDKLLRFNTAPARYEFINYDVIAPTLITNNIELPTDSEIYFDSPTNTKSLMYNSSSTQFEFNDIVYAPYFSGDGHLLTNITAEYFNETDPLWTGNSTLVAYLSDQANWNVNSSNYWDDLDTPEDIGHNRLANLSWSVANHTIDTNVDMNNYSLFNASLVNTTTAWIGDSANYSYFDHDGNLTLYGSAIKNKSITQDANNFYPLAGTYGNTPATYAASPLATLGITLFRRLTGSITGADVGEAFVCSTVIPKDRQNMSNLTLRIHFLQDTTAAGAVRVGVGTRAFSDGDSYVQTTTYYEQTYTLQGTQYIKQSMDFAIDGDVVYNGDVVALVVYRYGEAAADTYAGNLYVSNIELIYRKDRLGE